MSSEPALETGRLEDCQRQIFWMIARKRISLRVTDDNGHHPVIVVDEHSRLSDVIVQAARTDGYANLFVLSDDDTVAVADLLPAESSVVPTSDGLISDVIHRDIEVGMLVSGASEQRGGVSFSVELPRQRGTFRRPRKLDAAAF